MSLNAVKIIKGQVGANAGSGTLISGLILNGVATDDLDLDTSYKLLSVTDAAGLGITAAYDADNEVNVFRHIDEYFRMCKQMGILSPVLWIMVVSQDTMPEDILGISDDAVFAQKMIIDAGGDIRQLGVAFNPANDYADAHTDGINNDIYSALLVAQAFHQWTYETFRPCQVLIEGRSMNGAAVSWLDLRAIPNGDDKYQFTNVSLVIGQDYGYAESLGWELGKKYADVGNVLGLVAGLDVNQNIGEIETALISDAVRQKFNQAGISSHILIKDIESSWETIDAKGYIFPVKYTGVSGYRWNDDHTCTPVVIDDDNRMNEHQIALGRAVNEVVRSLRIVLLPEVKKTHQVDEQTGKLPIGVVKYFEGLGNDVILDYKNQRIISGGSTTVDPDSDLLRGEKALNVSFQVIPTGTVGVINGIINLKTSI